MNAKEIANFGSSLQYISDLAKGEVSMMKRRSCVDSFYLLFPFILLQFLYFKRSPDMRKSQDSHPE